MKKTFILAILLMISVCLIAQDLLSGKWEVQNPGPTFKGFTNYEIYLKDEQYLVKLMSAYNVRGFYTNSEKAIYFVIEGFGPDGPLMKLVFEKNLLREYSLENGEWVLGHLYKKRK